MWSGSLAGVFAPGHLGELTRIVPFEMVDAALAETGSVQQRLRLLPSRVVVYLLLAAGLFAEIGLSQVWTRLCAGLDGLAVATPTAGALAQARRRIGVAPLRALFDLLRRAARPPACAAAEGRVLAGAAGHRHRRHHPVLPGHRWRICSVYHPAGGGYHGGTGYPMVRLLALVACGTRTVIDATFG